MAEKTIIGSTTIYGKPDPEDIANQKRFYADEPVVDVDPINGTNWKKTWDSNMTSKRSDRDEQDEQDERK